MPLNEYSNPLKMLESLLKLNTNAMIYFMSNDLNDIIFKLIMEKDGKLFGDHFGRITNTLIMPVLIKNNYAIAAVDLTGLGALHWVLIESDGNKLFIYDPHNGEKDGIVGDSCPGSLITKTEIKGNLSKQTMLLIKTFIYLP